ncbi:hypothetical protein GCM10011313_24540 [Mycetocola zhadangensis]|nr:hypothetical protein GCM10011313_24540 [Mycetocola zhadangensis]
MALEFTLVAELDVTELGAPGAISGVDVDRRRGPDVGLAVRRRVEHLDGLGTPEAFLGTLGDPGANPLTWEGVCDKNHSALKPGYEHTTVGYVCYLKLDICWGIRLCIHL